MVAEKEPDGERVSPVPMGGDALAGRGDEGCDCVCSVASVVASGEEGRESAGGGDVGKWGPREEEWGPRGAKCAWPWPTVTKRATIFVRGPVWV